MRKLFLLPLLAFVFVFYSCERMEVEYVDLGLSVKWATCNVGAKIPEDYGDYFAWGEMKSKAVYDWSTYKHCGKSEFALTKYCVKEDYGIVDDKIILESVDDVVTKLDGEMGRIPTKEEFEELKERCVWEWIMQNGVNGYKVTGPNGNSIFLPVAGCIDGDVLDYTNSGGYYWISSLHTGNPTLAYRMYFVADYQDITIGNRCLGLSIRPVCK